MIGLSSISEWLEYIKQGKKPSKTPSNPDNYYKREWKGWGDWLGTGTVAPRDRSYKTFEDARNHVHSLGLRSQSEWYRYCKSGAKPLDIPVNPYSGYKKEWKGWIDWLGYEEDVWSVKRVKGLLSDLIKSRVIYEWDEAVLYSLLLRKGL